jgi:UDP-2-acetamido-2,6-beta-L-arabino-hexul-4-ose reductase
MAIELIKGMCDKRNILITGSNGFIGKNLTTRLIETNDFNLSHFNRDDDIDELSQLVANTDIVIHLAGENRPPSEENFQQVNVGLTRQICTLIQDEFLSNSRSVGLIFSSSIHALSATPYGKSKREAELLIEELHATTHNLCCVYRLPGVFGKWSKPNYNSVVSTFCHNVANDLPVDVQQPEKVLPLVYIDDVIDDILDVISRCTSGYHERKVEPQYEVSLGQIYKLLCKCRDVRKTNTIGTVGIGFERALYSTYLSYLSPSQFTYDLTNHSDDRGSFVEMLRTQNSGQISFFTAGPGVTRGKHYHHTKTEKFLVVKGTARFNFRNLTDNQTVQFNVDETELKVVDTIPGWVHDITNVGDDDLIVLLWANEVFDHSRPDTIYAEI